MVATEEGICRLAFFDTQAEYEIFENELSCEYQNAEICFNNEKIAMLGKMIFSKDKKDIQLVLRGTPFQIKVWQALQSIPEGSLCSYQAVADSIHQPKAVRAVASAIAKNNIAFLIPCHRVIRSDGSIGQYRWGSVRKQAMIAWENI
ncbi:MAG: MGMT family protein [Gammaproteobacteria bacterium]|nr:MGMT family protein [Gammaproteobacteria bacterium]